MKYNIVTENPESTVLSEYEPAYRKETEYQTEADLEKSFIALLQQQKYEYLPIKSEAELIANLRLQLEALNAYRFSDDEWRSFFMQFIANRKEGIVEKTRTIQEDYIKNLKRDNGEPKNIYLIDKEHIIAEEDSLPVGLPVVTLSKRDT